MFSFIVDDDEKTKGVKAIGTPSRIKLRGQFSPFFSNGLMLERVAKGDN